MKNFDQRWSDKIFYATKSSRVFTMIAKFCATYLFWIFTFITLLFTHSIVPHANYSFFSPWIFDGFMLLSVLFVPWFVTMVLSLTIRRKRPFRAEHHKALIHMPIETPSFPSAHATLAFALSVMYFSNPVLCLIALLIACLIAISRVCVGVHYVSDIIFGMLIGIVVGVIVYVNFTLVGV